MKSPTSERGSLLYLTLICLVATLGGLLFGYDTAVISGGIGNLSEHFALSDAGTGWAAGSALLGCMIGAALAGPASDWLGRRATLMLSAILFLISAIGTAIPETLNEFVVYRIIGGVGVGAASLTSPMYIAEISPARLRGRLVSLNQFAIVFGIVVVYFVNYLIALQGDHAWNVTTGWRWMFGSEAIPATSLLVLLFFVPESPRWLVKRGRERDARAILTRVGGAAQADRELTEINLALSHEKGTVLQMFEPGLRVALLIGVGLAILQQITGINVVIYYAPEILKSVVRESVDAALLQTVLVGAVNMIFTIIAIWTVDKLGRKPLMLIGASGMGFCLLAMSAAAYWEIMGPSLLIFMLGYIACFAISVGPVTWVILSEIFPTKIRGRAMGIAVLAMWLANYIVSQTFPMMNGNEWLVEKFNHAFPFWVYAAFCPVLALLVWRLVPETKGRSLEEIERMWLARAEEAGRTQSTAANSPR